jgi:hypothetical protein
MKGWVMPMTIFVLGVGLGVSSPMLLSRYVDPHLPPFLKKSIHPLEGSVTHKQRQENRLLITLTTQDGTILATFQHQVPEIDLLIEEQDRVTLDVRQYEPFVNDPPVLRVTKHQDVPAEAVPPTIPPPQSDSVPDTDPTLDPPGFSP